MKHMLIGLVATWYGLLGCHGYAQEQANAVPQESEGRYAQLNGFRMYYEINGEGEPLVLLHRFFMSGAMWDSYIDAFSEQYQLIIPDLRGHGRSTNPANKEASEKLLEVERWSPEGQNLPFAIFQYRRLQPTGRPSWTNLQFYSCLGKFHHRMLAQSFGIIFADAFGR